MSLCLIVSRELTDKLEVVLSIFKYTVWAALALPALKVLQPHLRSGAVIVIDNTIRAKERYKCLLEYIDADERFSRIRLPYAGGFDLCRYEF